MKTKFYFNLLIAISSVIMFAGSCDLFAQTVDGIISEGEYGISPYKSYNQCSGATSLKGDLWMKENGNYIYFAYVVSRGKNDNVYSTSISDVIYAGWNDTKGHIFDDLWKGCFVEFKLKNNSNVQKVYVRLDYLYKSGTNYSCGWNTGDPVDSYGGTGSTYVDQCVTSFLYNKDNGGYSSWLTKSPPYPEKDYPAWVYDVVYEFRVSKSVFGSGESFGSADITVQKEGIRSCTDIYKNSGVPTLSISDNAGICVNKGNDIIYTFNITNIGCQDMTSTKLTLTYDQFMTYASSSVPPISGSNNTQFSLGTLTSNQVKTMTVTVHSSNNTNVQYIYMNGEVSATTAAYFNGKGPKLSCYVTVKQSEQQATQICNPLPVELVSFTSAIVNKNVELKWKTATEVNNYGFEVHRQTSAGNWETIGFIEGHGTVNTPQDYSYTDPLIGNKGSSFKYRLKQIDRDGTIEYSPIIEANFKSSRRDFGMVSAYPNPFNPSSMLQFYVPSKMPVSLKIFNLLGQEVKVLINEEVKTTGTYSVMFDAKDFASGIYYAWLTSGESLKSVFKLTLMK